jgi:Plavaka transposase
LSGRPCDADGAFLPPNTSAPPRHGLDDCSHANDWVPYDSQVQFEVAELLFKDNQMSAGHIDKLLRLWAASLALHNDDPPFHSHVGLYETIDATMLGDVKWTSFSTRYDGNLPAGEVPPWMKATYDIWYCDPRVMIKNLLSSPDFKNEFDYSPVQEYDADGNHRFHNFMTGNWAWHQAVCSPYSGVVPKH